MGLFARGLIEWTHPSSVRPSASAESRQLIRIFKHYLYIPGVTFFCVNQMALFGLSRDSEECIRWLPCAAAS